MSRKIVDRLIWREPGKRIKRYNSEFHEIEDGVLVDKEGHFVASRHPEESFFHPAVIGRFLGSVDLDRSDISSGPSPFLVTMIEEFQQTKGTRDEKFYGAIARIRRIGIKARKIFPEDLSDQEKYTFFEDLAEVLELIVKNVEDIGHLDPDPITTERASKIYHLLDKARSWARQF